jgi:hypothetical protein
METATIQTHPDVIKYRENGAKTKAAFLKGMTNPFLYRLFLLQALPMGLFAGLRVKVLTEERSEITVPYKWLNKNPFQSTYFAVLAMAAEMSSGIISMLHAYKSNPSVAVLVTGIEADFVKKATGLTTFTCEEGAKLKEAIETAIATGQGQTCTTESIGRSKDGTIEAKFRVTWSFKRRK